MIFSDAKFFFEFLPLCILGFFIFGRFGRRPALGFLTFVSLAFYAAWRAKHVFILIGSILFNYAVSRRISKAAGKEKEQTRWLIFGIAVDLAVLGYFKYIFSLLEFFNELGGTHHAFSAVILPLGISFFTFTQIAYLVDLKQGVAGQETLLSYSLFVTFFPHLIAGPILHHKEIMPQLSAERPYLLNAHDVSLGLTWFTMGLFKKVVVADSISPLANSFFAAPQGIGAWDTWLGVLAFALQLYFDFSGYSDMAVGLARIFSIRFPLNFNSPYKAESIIEFWQRWHMTLTQYIMNYVYSPLLFAISRRRQEQGKKVSRKAQATAEGFFSLIAAPTLFTMFLAGIWHGAGLQFIAFGVLHGGYITVNHLWRVFLPAEGLARRAIRGPVAVVLTFLAAVAAEVLFRANSLRSAMTVYAGMAGHHGAGTLWSPRLFALIATLLFVVWFLPNTQELLAEQQKEDGPNWSLIAPRRWRPSLLWWLGTAVVFLISAAFSTAQSAFLYFQF